MVNIDELFGKVYKYLWLIAIAGSILIIIESLFNLKNVLEAGFSIGLSIIVIICMLLSRFEIHGTAFAALVCSSILFLSPVGFSGFDLGVLLILVGALISTTGGFYTYTVFFFYLAIGAIMVDLIMFFLTL